MVIGLAIFVAVIFIGILGFCTLVSSKRRDTAYDEVEAV